MKRKNKVSVKVLAMFLCVCVLFSGAPITAVALNEASYDGTPVTPQLITSENYADYNLTAENYAEYEGCYGIRTAAELYGFAELVNGGENYADAKLTANITVNKGVLDKNGALVSDTSGFYSWTPIGNSSKIYYGMFDGKKNDTENYTISGLYFNNENADYVGLFGYSKGRIQNIGVVDSYIKGREYVGGVVGENYKGAVTNCYNTGNVSGTDWYVGGVAGYNVYNGDVTNCYNTGNVSGTDRYVGGVVGYNAYSGSVTNCYNTGNISGIDHERGGVVGYNAYSGDVTNCYNTGNISGMSAYVGSVVGRNYNATVTNCYYLKGSVEMQNGIGGWDALADVKGSTTVKTADQFTSGEVAYLLQKANGSKLVWGQKSSKDGATPILTSNEDYRVIPVKDGDTVVNYSVLHMGDTNGDGEVNIYDYQNAVNIALSMDNDKATAEKYDLNKDGVIDVMDCLKAEMNGASEELYNDILKKSTTSTGMCYMSVADTNSDGVVDALDIAALERLLSGHRVIK